MVSKFFNDETRALIVAFFPDIFSLAIAFGLDVSSEQQSLAVSAMTKFIVLVFYVFKQGQSQGPEGNSIAQQKASGRT